MLNLYGKEFVGRVAKIVIQISCVWLVVGWLFFVQLSTMFERLFEFEVYACRNGTCF